MSDNWKIQVSVKLPHDNDNYRDTLVNLRADTPEELATILGWVEGNAASITSAAQTIKASAGVAGAFPGPGTQNVQPGAVQHYQQAAAAPPEQGWPAPAQQGPPAWAGQQQAPAQAAPQAANQPPAPACAHGPMQYRESKPGAAKTWKAWMCSAPKGPGQCEPNWIR